MFNPKKDAAAWYDPDTDEITLNLSKVGIDSDEDEFLVVNLAGIITHEYAHKAVKHTLDKSTTYYFDKLGSAVANIINGKEGSEEELHRIVDGMVKMISMDEAYAYSTGATIQRQPKVNVVESVSAALLDPMENMYMHFKGQMDKLPNPDMRRNETKRLRAFFMAMERHIKTEALTAEAAILDFISDMSKLTSEEKDKYVQRYVRKVQNIMR